MIVLEFLFTLEGAKFLCAGAATIALAGAAIGILKVLIHSLVRNPSLAKQFFGYTIPEDDLELGQLRLLEVDNRVVVPAKCHLRHIVTSADVLHSWAVPSSGVKCDAVPGRLNQISVSVLREGVYYGQCKTLWGGLSISLLICLLGISFFWDPGTFIAYCDGMRWSPGVEAPQLPQFHGAVHDAAPPRPVIPEVNPPLMPIALRQWELARPLHTSFLGATTWVDFTRFVNTLYSHCIIDRRVQDALIVEGYSPGAILARRGEIRDVLFFRSNGDLISERTLNGYIQEITTLGTRESRPFRRVIRAIGRADILMPLPRRGGR